MEYADRYNYPLTVKLLQSENLIAESHDNFEILLGLKGSANLIFNNKTYRFEKNDIILINPLEAFQITNCKGVIVSVTIKRNRLEMAENVLDSSYYCNSLDYTNQSVFYNLEKIIGELIKNYDKPSFDLTNAFSYAYQIMAELTHNFPTSKIRSTSQKNKMDEIIDYIENNYQKNLTLNELADAFNFSVPYLSNLFKKNLNLNFTEYYDEVRLKHSVKDLLETDLPIIDIALKNGFASNHAFLRAYKQKYKELPSETRRKQKSSRQNYNDELTAKDERGLEELVSDLEKVNEKAFDLSLYEEVKITGSEAQKAILDLSDKSVSISVNNARNLVYEAVRKAVIETKKRAGVKYIYLCGIFSDGLYFCSRDKSGKLQFRFNLINEILDFIVKLDLIPLLSLTYMPKALAKDKNKTVFADEYNTSAPAKIEEWVTMLKTFLDHILERYGKDIVRNWYFIPWRQPDTTYNYMGFETDEEFYYFYKATYDTIKSYNSNYIVTSPELLPITEKKLEWFKRFMVWTKENFCLPNQICLEFYMDDNWDILETYPIRGKSFTSIPYNKPTTDKDKLAKYLTTIRNFLNINNTRIPIIITRYSFTISHYNILSDTIFSADFLLKNMIDNINKTKVFTYNRISDFEETIADINYFSGGTGMYYKNGVPKPNLHALSFWASLENEILARGENYILASNAERNHLTLLLHNYEHPNDSLVDSDIFSLALFDRYSPFVNKVKKKVIFNFDTKYTRAKITTKSINKQHGSPYDKWLECGKPPIDTYSSLESFVDDIIKIASYPDYLYEEKGLSKGLLHLEVLLEPLEVKFIDIKLGR